MKMSKGIIFTVAVVVICLSGKWAEAQVHHVVGADRGWDPTSDLLSWSSTRLFRVGDQLWLTYSVAQGLVAELKSREEYESCDVRNPIKLYREGLHSIPLEKEGVRYFVSTEAENCKNGLKLHFEVLPMADQRIIKSSSTLTEEAAPPTIPSASTQCGHNTMFVPTAIFCFCLIIGLVY